jgi:uncharacterized protein (DUF488 family)
MAMKIFTIGFTRKSAEVFFTKLQRAGVRKLVDVRLNNVSQLAGFAKRDDLSYFLRAICNINYGHFPELAPTQEMMDEYKKHNGDWDLFQCRFIDLLTARKVENKVPRELFEGACLLCSEDKPSYCHRRLVAEYLKGKWGDVEIEHIV